MAQNEVIVDIAINAAEFTRYYQRPGAIVSVRSVDGRTVRFPANLLQRFVTHAGINGRFAIAFTAAGKFERIDKIG